MENNEKIPLNIFLANNASVEIIKRIPDGINEWEADLLLGLIKELRPIADNAELSALKRRLDLVALKVGVAGI